MAELRAADKAAGGFFFAPRNVRAHGGQVHGAPVCGPNGVFFVDSEQEPRHYHSDLLKPRLYSVRTVVPTEGGVRIRSAEGHHMTHRFAEDARAAARTLAGDARPRKTKYEKLLFE